MMLISLSNITLMMVVSKSGLITPSAMPCSSSSFLRCSLIFLLLVKIVVCFGGHESQVLKEFRVDVLMSFSLALKTIISCSIMLFDPPFISPYFWSIKESMYFKHS